MNRETKPFQDVLQLPDNIRILAALTALEEDLYQASETYLQATKPDPYQARRLLVLDILFQSLRHLGEDAFGGEDFLDRALIHFQSQTGSA